MSVPIHGIITTVCLNLFAHTESCYFSEIQARVSQAGGNVGEGFLASTLERIGYTVDDKARPWIVRA